MKITDKLLEAFLWVWELVMCSLALPLALGLSWLLIGVVSDMLDKIYFAVHKSPIYPYWFYGVSIIAGIFLKIWLVNRRKGKKKSE